MTDVPYIYTYKQTANVFYSLLRLTPIRLDVRLF